MPMAWLGKYYLLQNQEVCLDWQYKTWLLGAGNSEESF